MKTSKIKIWVSSFLAFLCFCSFTYNLAHSASWDQYNQYLVTLLHDETDPFFPDTIRHSFLRVGVKATSSVCMVGEYSRLCDVGSLYGMMSFPTYADTFHNFVGIRAIWSKDSSFALPHVGESNVALKSIATTTEMQYWYATEEGANVPQICIYPPPDTSGGEWDSVLVFAYGTPHIEYMHPAYDHLVVLYALHLCYLRQGEKDVAQFIGNIFNSLRQDMYVITEGREVDVTIGKKVIP